MTCRLLLTTLALVLVGCSSGDGGGPAELTSVQAVYDQVRAAGVEVGPLQMLTEPALMTQEKGKAARPDGTDLYVYIPTPSWDREAFLSLLDAAGGFTVSGPRWVVNVEGRQPAERIADALGGTVR